MAQEHDELFAKYSIQLKLLTPAKVMECRDVHEELESAGVTKLLAIVAVDQGALSRADAVRLIDAINRKFPGKHPPLPPVEADGAVEEAPVPSGKLAPEAPRPARQRLGEGGPPRKAGSAPASALKRQPSAARPGAPARRSPPEGGPAAPAKSPAKVFMIVGAVAAVVVIAVVAFMMGAKQTPPPVVVQAPQPERTESPKPANPAPGKPEPTTQVPDPKPALSPEAKEAPKSEPKVEIKPPPPPAAPQDDFRKEFEEQQAERKKEAKARYDEVVRELAQERKEADQAAAVARKRFEGKKISLTLTSKETLKDAVIRSYTFHGADLDVGGKETRITWDTVEPASLPPVADAIFDPARAQDQFDRGRFFVARRMWKDAQAAFAAAAKLGGGYESRVLEFSEVLDRLVSGQGGFRGSARRTGRDSVHLTWDFHDAKQLEDFTPGLAFADKTVTLESPRKVSVYFFGGTSSGSGDSPLAFAGQLTATLKLTSEGGITFHLFMSETGGYEIDLGPAGAALFKIDPRAPEKDRRKQIAKADKVKLVAGKASDVVVDVRFPKFTVTVNKAEALAAEDGPVAVTAEPPKGAFGFGLPEKGKLRIEAPLSLQGRADAAELDRRINDTEVMVRRALDPDLEQIERFRSRKKAMQLLGETPDRFLSADHIYFLERLKPDYNVYQELKKNFGGIPDKQTPEQWKTEMDTLIAKHPQVPSLYFVRARFKYERQDLIGALADAKKAVEIFPDFHEALALQASILLSQQEPEEALQAVRRAVEARPDYLEGFVLRARCIFATTQSMQAFMEDLDIARKLDPQDSTAVTVQRMLKYQRLGPRELGCRFEHETPHYRVTTDINAEATKRYGENLEAAFRHYSQEFKGAGPRLSRKPRVAIFNTAENYYTYFELLSEDRGENTAGVFWPGLNELVLFERGGDAQDTHHTLYHEAVHQFMTLLTNRTPPYWYNEGIAEYMGSIKVQDGKVLEKGVILKGRLPHVQLAIEVKADLAFEKIMNETPGEFYSGAVGLKYAQAWSMIHFFYEYGKAKYRPLIEEYFELLRAGRTPRDCYDKVFKAKAETLQQEWREFTKGLK